MSNYTSVPIPKKFAELIQSTILKDSNFVSLTEYVKFLLRTDFIKRIENKRVANELKQKLRDLGYDVK